MSIIELAEQEPVILDNPLLTATPKPGPDIPAAHASVRRLLFLYNPVSGTLKKDGVIEFLRSAVPASGIPFDILPTQADGDYRFVRDRVIRELFTDIIIIGGDGTVNQVVSALNDLPVRFGIIPSGSGNGLALSAGIPKKAEQAWQLILEGKAQKTDAFLVNGKFACMLSGLGFDAQVAHSFAAKEGRGLFTYTQQSLMNYFKAQPYQFEVEIDGFSFFTDAFFISIANSNQFGNNVTIAPKADLHDGLLDIVVVQKMNKARLPFAVLKQIRGNNQLQQLVDQVSTRNILYFQADSLKIRNLKYAPMHIDGEPVETAAEVSIQALPGRFPLICQA